MYAGPRYFAPNQMCTVRRLSGFSLTLSTVYAFDISRFGDFKNDLSFSKA